MLRDAFQQQRKTQLHAESLHRKTVHIIWLEHGTNNAKVAGLIHSWAIHLELDLMVLVGHFQMRVF